MNQDLKTKWVKALRSGIYKQGQMRLRREVGVGELFSHRGAQPPKYEYCCLGVLCEVVGKPYTGSAGGLSWEVSDLAELPWNTQQHLVGINDSGKYSFSQIADWIEENL